MGRHRTPEEKQELGERARAMRAAGRPRREIEQELGIGDDLAKELLRGVPLPDSLARPRAKDELRVLAVQLRRAGRTYDQISAELGVSKSTCSLWLRDVPFQQQELLFDLPTDVPEFPADRRSVAAAERRGTARRLRRSGLLLREIAAELGVTVKTAHVYTVGLPPPTRAKHGGDLEHVRRMNEKRWGQHRRSRDAASQQRKLDAARQVGDVDDQALLLLGAMAYWCEGTKSKPWRPRSSFTFINSDPLIMRLFVRWLQLLDVPPERWVVRIQIHETADLEAAEVYWRHILGLPELAFGKPVIKRHVPLTRRKNTGQSYHGCARLYVRKGVPLLEQVEGWMVGALLGAGGALPERPMPWPDDAVAG